MSKWSVLGVHVQFIGGCYKISSSLSYVFKGFSYVAEQASNIINNRTVFHFVLQHIHGRDKHTNSSLFNAHSGGRGKLALAHEYTHIQKTRLAQKKITKMLNRTPA